jgi:photosystem II stability/assembly factor-like uncharacterized protein
MESTSRRRIFVPRMRNAISACFTAALLSSSAHVAWAQHSGWSVLPNAPVAGRHDDIHFVDPQRGWAVDSSGKIHRTTNGGNSWVQQLQASEYFRSVYFSDAQHGWAGTLGGANLLYATTNGGAAWQPVTNLPSPGPDAVCGLSGFGSDLIVATGAYHGPAKFTRSTDGGATWTTKDMSGYARNLVDCHFFSPDSGFAVGGSPSPSEGQSHPVILLTADRGDTWQTVHHGSRNGSYGWKIFFQNAKNGWVSAYDTGGAQVFKTTDGGLHWVEQQVPNNDALEGIGFASETLGWTDGWGSASQTVNGGQTWTPVDLEGNFNNRFVMFGDSVGYAAGRTIMKYDPSVSSVEEPPTAESAFRDVLQLSSHPNPTSGRATIEFILPESAPVTVRVYTALGRHVVTIVDGETMLPGRQSVEWSGRDAFEREVPSGRYLYRVDAGREASSRILTLIR